MAGATGTKTKGKETKKKGGKPDRGAITKQVTDAILAVSDELGEAFPKWSAYLQRRKLPKPLWAVLKAEKIPLLWSVEPQDVGADARALVKKLHKVSAGNTPGLTATATDWCGDALTRKPTAEFGLECLAWTAALPQLTQALDAQLWAALLGTLLDIAKSDYGSLAEKNPWDSQLILGELPIALGYSLPEFDECLQMLKRGCDFASSSINELLDGEGVCEAQHLAILRKLAACWIRCAWMTNDATKKSHRLSKSARKELDWLIRQVLRLTRSDRSYVFQPLGEKPSSDIEDMIGCALRWSRDSEDRALAKLVLAGEDVSDSRLPEGPSFHSEWSELAILQPEWDPKSPRLTLTFDNSRIRAELCNRGEVIFSGPWEPTFQVDGRQVEVVSEWEVNCWFSDFDVDYLELEAELTGGWQIQRQFVMARQDHFLWTADVLLGERAGDIRYELHTELADGVAFRSDGDSREGQIKGRRLLATVCAPVLPEWRQESHLGDLNNNPDGMTLTYRRRGRAMYVPLFFDLHRRRMRQPITWRQLTVGENLEIVTADVAVGFRVQVGPEQWLGYRSLNPEGNRTVLGQNYSEEFVLGRFLQDGDVEALVEIEGAEEE